MTNEYIESLAKELESEGVVSIDNSSIDFEEKRSNDVIDYMERQLNIKYSEEQKAILRHRGSSVILACAGSGKALVNGTKVLTIDGFKPIEEINIGDTTYNSHGIEQKVVGVYPQSTQHTIYDVILNNGLSIKCTEDHLWKVKDSSLKWSVIETEKMFRVLKSRRAEYLTLPSLGIYEYRPERAFTCSDSYVRVAIDEYLPDLEEFLELAVQGGINYESMAYDERVTRTYNRHLERYFDYIAEMKSYTNSNAYKIEFNREYNCFRIWRYLCIDYLDGCLNSIEASEMIEKACRVFGTTSKYYINAGGRIEKEPLRIVDIVETNEVRQSTCIKVDNDEGIFLAEDYIPTHNTTINTHLIAKRIQTREIQDTDKLIYATYNRAGMEEMQLRMEEILKKLGLRNRVQVRTIHSFFLSLIREFGITAGILSDAEKYRMIGEACKYAGYTPKEDEKTLILNVLSYQINNLVTSAKALAFSGSTMRDLELWQYDTIIGHYANAKQKQNKMDYDDMQSFLYLWLCKWCDSDNPQEREISRQVKEYCQFSYNDFYIDEAQDVSKMQFEILRAMMTNNDDKHKLTARLTFIGDDDQCLLPDTKILTNSGAKFIKDVTEKDRVKAYIGNNIVWFCAVDKVSKRQVKEEIIRITTERGREIRGTYNHIGFATFRDDRGFCNPLVEYAIVEYSNNGLYTIKGINKARLEDISKFMKYSCDRNMKLHINRVLDNEDEVCDVGIKNRLMEKYPNTWVDGDYSIKVSLFSSDKKNALGIQNSTIEIENSDYEGETELCEYKSMKLLEDNLDMLERVLGYKARRCAIIHGIEYDMVNFGAIVEGMYIPIVDDNGEIKHDRVVKVSREQYTGYVYDLRIDQSRNFVADGVIVHNCIYEWRGSSPSIIQSAGTEFNIRNFVLSSNYRCKSEIVDYATRGVVQNNMRFEKGMSSNDIGGKVSIALGGDSYCDIVKSSILALNQIKSWVQSGKRQSQIAVLARNNCHLTALNILLIWSGIYTDSTEDMKVTKSQLYKDIRMVMRLSEDCWDANTLWKNIWKFYRYTPRAVADMLCTIQNGCACTTKDTLALVLSCMGVKLKEQPKIDINSNLIGPIERKYIKDLKLRVNAELRSTLFMLYEAMCKETESIRFKLISNIFLSGQKEVCKTYDKYREIEGVFKILTDISTHKTDMNGLKDFLLMLEQYEKGSVGVMGDKVTLSTIHSAKGREWKNVIMFACDNAGHPNLESLRNLSYGASELELSDINAYIDEERRVFYVGNTRAKENLLIITCNKPSVFILEALGAEVGNSKIIYFAEYKNAILSEYYDTIKENINNPESKYYYNLDEI